MLGRRGVAQAASAARQSVPIRSVPPRRTIRRACRRSAAKRKGGEVRAGQRVLVHAAAGGVGTAALQICRRIRAEVIGTASAAKHARLREMGLAHAIDYRTQDFEAEVKRITGGRGVHVVMDAVGGASIKKGWRCLAPTGKLVVFGASSVTAGPAAALSSLLRMTPFWPLRVMQENKALVGVNIGRLWGEQEM